MLMQYIPKKFNEKALLQIEQANTIIEEYRAEGDDLTLRQLYYQFVARGLLENIPINYKKLGVVINDARLAGLVSWEAIVDRTRNLQTRSRWDGPKDIVAACSQSFHMDHWANQENRVEVWIEKDALIGVIANVCHQLDVPYFSCRGYTSQSEMWSAGQRFAEYIENGQTPTIIHLGDHDPSGVDMTRDIQDRLEMFNDNIPIAVKRVALNMDQVHHYNPPPNPAKITDKRAVKYIKRYGEKSWELDALEPRVLRELVQRHVLSFRDDDLLENIIKKEDKHKKTLLKLAKSMKE